MNDCWLHQGGILIPGRIASQNQETLATIFQGDDGCGYPCMPIQVVTDRRVALEIAFNYLSYWSRVAQELSDNGEPLPEDNE